MECEKKIKRKNKRFNAAGSLLHVVTKVNVVPLIVENIKNISFFLFLHPTNSRLFFVVEFFCIFIYESHNKNPIMMFSCILSICG